MLHTMPTGGAGEIPFFQSSWSEAAKVGIRTVRAWRADVVHLHTAMLWYVAEAIQAATRTPIVYHVHSVDRVIPPMLDVYREVLTASLLHA